MKTSQTNNVLLAGALGFAAGLLFAPRSGTETREQLRVQAEEAKARMRNAKGELQKQVSEKADQLKDAADTVKDKGKIVKDTALKHADEAQTEMKARV